jgi:type II secretory pathway pseudopilin PulG
MTLIKTGIIALALTASLGTLATSASAQTRAERNAAAREARAQAQEYRAQQRYLPGAAAYESYGYANGATDRLAPNECRIDNGYGRFDTCDH